MNVKTFHSYFCIGNLQPQEASVEGLEAYIHVVLPAEVWSLIVSLISFLECFCNVLD